MSAFSCIVLFCIGRSLEMGQSPIQGVLSKCVKGFIVSEVTSEFEQARGLNSQNENIKIFS
jgi:hypothetical protein